MQAEVVRTNHMHVYFVYITGQQLKLLTDKIMGVLQEDSMNNIYFQVFKCANSFHLCTNCRQE